MADGIVEVQVDASEAKSATIEAEVAARDAELAAATAVGATVAQSGLIGQVMEHAREDARESAMDAEQAAQESASSAETAVAVNSITAEMIARLETRIAELEGKHAEMEARSTAPPEEDVTEIVPEGSVPGGDGEGEAVETNSVSSGNKRRRHGRRNRR